METKAPHVGVDKPRRGYKIVNKNLCGRNNFQYAIGRTATTPGELELCVNGLHFCYDALSCLRYCRDIQAPFRYLQVIPKSEVQSSGHKSATLNLLIEAEITPIEWLAQCHEEFQAKIQGDPFMLFEMGVAENDMTTIRLAITGLDLLMWGRHLLNTAAVYGQIGIMQFLIKSGIRDYSSAALTAMNRNRPEVLEFLLKADMSQAEKDDALTLATTADMAMILIRGGAKSLNEALNLAARYDKLPMVQFFIGAGATDIYMAICWAASYGAIRTSGLGTESLEYIIKLPQFDYKKAIEVAKYREVPSLVRKLERELALRCT